jgi:hypothetical protein
MTTRSMQRRQFSRTKLDLYLECARCFYDDVVLGLGRVGGPAFSLNIAVDALFKDEFDGYRAAGTPHPLFATVGLVAVPFAHPELDTWRNNFKGVRWVDPATDWALFGAVDDLWQRPDGALIVADYKATAKKDEITPWNIYPGYKRQLEIYQFLIEQQGFKVDATSWLVYANGIKTGGRFDDMLRFVTKMIPVECDRAWVQGTFADAVRLVEGGQRPAAAEGCAWCGYVEGRSALPG